MSGGGHAPSPALSRSAPDVPVLLALVIGVVFFDCVAGVFIGLVAQASDSGFEVRWWVAAAVGGGLMLAQACILVVGFGIARSRDNRRTYDDDVQTSGARAAIGRGASAGPPARHPS